VKKAVTVVGGRRNKRNASVEGDCPEAATATNQGSQERNQKDELRLVYKAFEMKKMGKTRREAQAPRRDEP
jgi:hypothetical protein